MEEYLKIYWVDKEVCFTIENNKNNVKINVQFVLHKGPTNVKKVAHRQYMYLLLCFWYKKNNMGKDAQYRILDKLPPQREKVEILKILRETYKQL